MKGRWRRDESVFGTAIGGKRLGVVGLGRIGSVLARLARGVGMEVWAYDPYRRRWPRWVRRAKTLAELLPRSDFLTLHVPLTDETNGMIGAKELAKLPRGALLVNTARGAVVEKRALLAALRRNHLAAAALDVFDPEPPERNDPLLLYARSNPDRLLVTPHLGASTRETVEKVAKDMARRLLAALA